MSGLSSVDEVRNRDKCIDLASKVKPRRLFRTMPAKSTRRTRGRGEVALERALSKLGLASRSEARRRIAAGDVTVDGVVERDPLRPVVPERAAIALAGQHASRAPRVVVLLHKPRGVVTTRRDPEGRRTVYDCLAGLDVRVVPVGRLDAASSGLLLLTNDTRLADALTDPANAVARTYLVTVRGRVEAATAEAAVEGREDRGELLRASSVQVRKASGRESHLVVDLRQGKNREIRRLFAALGHEVTALKRVAFGDYTLGDLAPGQYRVLDAPERR
jgi:23S rRNA pseudouridine2605 synthase